MLPDELVDGIRRVEDETSGFDQVKGYNLKLNVCLSYGARGEIVNAVRDIVKEFVSEENRDVACDGDNIDNTIDESFISSRLCSGGNHRNNISKSPDPDIIIRTSGEMRISNFLLWQIAYSELFFIEKNWPEITRNDLESVILDYRYGRSRRFGV